MTVRDQAFTLTDFSDAPGTLYQIFTGRNLFAIVSYTNDGSIESAKISAEANFSDLEDHDYYGPYVKFRPAILDSPDYLNQQWTLKDMAQDILYGPFHQGWTSDQYFVSVHFDEAFNLILEQVRDSDWTIRENREYYNNGNLKKIEQRFDAVSLNKKQYYKNGNLEYDLNETQQGIPVGNSLFYTEEGTLKAQQDFERFPFHHVGYQKVKEIVKEHGFSEKISPVLQWTIADPQLGKLHIDAPPLQ